MATYDDAPNIDVQLQINTVERTPCVLVLDVSGSMHGERIRALNEGLVAFERELKADEIAIDQVVVQVIEFGGEENDADRGVRIIQDWTDASDFVAPSLSANGLTPMGIAMDLALSEIDSLKGKFRSNGITYTRPWIFLMTDGGPNDDNWEESAARSRAAVARNQAIVWPIAMPEAHNQPLFAFAGDNAEIISVETAQFSDLFQWLSRSLGCVAELGPGRELQLPAPPGRVIQT